MHTSKEVVDSENGRPNLYKAIHKYLRVEIAEVTGLLGSTDFGNKVERDQCGVRFKDLMKLLDEHARCEEKYIHPLLETCKSKELKIIEEEHQCLDKQLASLKLNSSRIDEEQAAYQFYLDLTQFQANFLSLATSVLKPEQAQKLCLALGVEPVS